MKLDFELLKSCRYKYTANINPLFKEGKQIARKRSNTLIGDGVPNFNQAFNKEFWTRRIRG